MFRRLLMEIRTLMGKNFSATLPNNATEEEKAQFKKCAERMYAKLSLPNVDYEDVAKEMVNFPEGTIIKIHGKKYKIIH